MSQTHFPKHSSETRFKTVIQAQRSSDFCIHMQITETAIV